MLDVLFPCVELAPMANETERLLLRFDVGNRVAGRPGHLHGGAIGTMFDVAIDRFLQDLCRDSSAAFRIVDMAIEYLRESRIAQTYFEVTVVRRGNRVINIAASAWQQQQDRPIALCRSTALLEPQE